ncbi:MAG: hypothetical protein RLZZ132_1497, partial [Bacteroidota bacterium]
MNRSRIALFLLLVFALTGAYFVWKPAAEVPAAEVNIVETPDFKADSAYAFIEKQVQFGPRVPGSEASQNTLKFLVAKLKSYGWTVTEQPFTAFRYDGKKLQGTNIIAQFQPAIAKRILLSSHWDSRSIADKDSIRKNEPIDAANDGASGVGVLLEIARNLHETKNKPAVGVDIVLFDLEDHGEPEDYAGEHKPNSWALGSQHWAANLVPANYRPYYGILLDMVGGKGAMFPHEGTSIQYAPGIVRSVWATAADLGYSNLFVDQDAFGISDDHTAVNEIAKIQMIDMIDLRAVNGGFEFGSFHHTHADN